MWLRLGGHVGQLHGPPGKGIPSAKRARSRLKSGFKAEAGGADHFSGVRRRSGQLLHLGRAEGRSDGVVAASAPHRAELGITRLREAAPDLFDGHGWRWRVIRTSNAYNFQDPVAPTEAPVPSKCQKPTGTANQAFFSSLPCHFSPSNNPDRSAAVTGREGRSSS